MEILFSKHEIGIYVRAEEHPTLSSKFGTLAMITMGSFIYTGELSKIESKMVKNDDGDEEVFIHVIMKVDTCASAMESVINHPGSKKEITDNVEIHYDGVKDVDKDEFNFEGDTNE